MDLLLELDIGRLRAGIRPLNRLDLRLQSDHFLDQARSELGVGCGPREFEQRRGLLRQIPSAYHDPTPTFFPHRGCTTREGAIRFRSKCRKVNLRPFGIADA